MPPYDAGWNRGPRMRPYDRGFAPRGPAGGYDFGGDFRPHPGWGGRIDRERAPGDGWTVQRGGVDFDDASAAGGLYGPARYGLGPYHERLRSRRRPDEELKEEVEEALFYDTWVDAEAVAVEVEDGIVTLRGDLPDYDEVRYATDDAWDVDGVRGVRSELRVRERAETPEEGESRREAGAAS